jgi:cobalamin synthase
LPRLISLRLAIGFLTTLPLPQPSVDELTAHPAAWGKSFAWYPLVGGIIGGLLIAAHWLLTFTHFSPLVQAGLLLLLWVMLTGALHLDGLLDACDALFAPVSTARRLEILKDVHTGAFAVFGATLAVGLKWALLAQLLAQPGASSWLGLVLAPILGRWLMVYAATRYPYARPAVEGAPISLGSFMRQGLDRTQLDALYCGSADRPLADPTHRATTFVAWVMRPAPGFVIRPLGCTSARRRAHRGSLRRTLRSDRDRHVVVDCALMSKPEKDT